MSSVITYEQIKVEQHSFSSNSKRCFMHIGNSCLADCSNSVSIT